MGVSPPWWSGLELRVLRHVRAVLRRRGLDLAFTESDQVPEGAQVVARAPIEIDGRCHGAILAIGPTTLEGPGPWELSVVRDMLTEAARDVVGALRERQSGDHRRRAADPALPRTSFGAIIGGAPAMQRLYALLDKVARAESTVLIGGENGTGKELVARAIHDLSDRREQPFVVTNCSAFNDNLLDSELFGHVRGAFTGAVADKPGLFEIADGGTFFLDEIGDMSPALQVKVLRVLQEGTFNRVGDTAQRRVDVRMLAATNRDLGAMVAAGEFREDLYYRINVIGVQVPALRERVDDIPLLVEHFMARQRGGGGRIKRLSNECFAKLLAHPWPGNVRELENEIERVVVLVGDSPVIGAELLSNRIRQWGDDAALGAARPLADPYDLPAAVEILEKKMIGEALTRHRHNKTRAADELKVSRRNLIRLVQKYGLE